MRHHEITKFKHGVVNSIESHSIPEGAASDALNWLTKGDKIELRRGYQVVGTEEAGSGKVTGLHVARRADGASQLFKTSGQKLKYYDNSTEDWVETTSANLLGSDADGEDITFADYTTNAGNQVWLNSKNSSLYKIMVANPADPVDQYNSTKNYKGRIKVTQNRMTLWGTLTDATGVYGSYVDSLNYTTVSGEVLGTGDGATVTFSGTLAFKGSGARRTCFAISVTDGTETFTDDYNGVLTGSAGGTGTINYATGAISVTFNAAVANSQNVTVDYQWEDSTNNGIADFTKSNPRQAGEGFTFRQDDGGGDLQNIMTYQSTEFCFHEHKTWELTLTSDDTNATNTIFRQNVGIPNWRAAVDTGEGIFYIDDSDEKDPQFRNLRFDAGSSEIIPVTISYNIDLSGYRFDQGAAFRWGDLVLFSCRTADSNANNRVIIFDQVWKSFDIIEAYVSCFANWDGVLIVGDSLSNNVYKLFSGFDDDDSVIDNYWVGNLSKLGIKQLKKAKRLILQGEIAQSQELTVYLAYDRGSFVEVGTISGSGGYVDTGSSISVGSVTVGSSEVGGGGDGVEAYNYVREIRVKTDKFDDVQVKIKATDVGYASVSGIKFWDLKTYGYKVASKYRA